MKVLVSACLESAKTLKDRSIKLVFETQEMSAEQCAQLFSLRNQIGWLIFASENETEVNVPQEPPQEFKTNKTPSKRMRDVMFVWWKQTSPNQDFESFYRDKIETVINWIKDKLEPEEN